MRRPPRPPGEPFLTAFLIWRVVFVSALFLAGIFGMFAWALERGQTLEEARTVAVNTLVVMEIFYLFNVRYTHGTSLTWQGVLGTPAVLSGIIFVTGAQFAFTYLPFMQEVFGTRPVALMDGGHGSCRRRCRSHSRRDREAHRRLLPHPEGAKPRLEG